VDGATEPTGSHVLPATATAPRRGLLRVPAFWVLLGLLAAGGWRMVQLLNGPIAGYPGPALLAIILFGLYAVPFVLVVRAFDFLEREPPALLAAAFAWGALVATATAAAGDSAAHDLLAKQVSPAFASQWGSALIAPFFTDSPLFAGPYEALIGACAGAGLIAIVGWLGEAALKREAMGMGDMTLMAFVGAALGPARALATVFVGATLGAVIFLAIVYPLAYLRRGRVASQTELALGESPEELTLPLVPFGVFLAPAAVIMLFFGDELLNRVLLGH